MIKKLHQLCIPRFSALILKLALVASSSYVCVYTTILANLEVPTETEVINWYYNYRERNWREWKTRCRTLVNFLFDRATDASF
jgi:hypothetical protein